MLGERVTLGDGEGQLGLGLDMQEETFPQTLFFALYRSLASAFGFSLCLHPSQEARDKHTRSEASQCGAQPRRTTPHRGPPQRSLPQRCAAALPSAEKRLPPGQKELYSGVTYSARRDSSI